MQKKYYRAIFEKNRNFLYHGCEKKNMPSLINIEMQLRKVCNHPFLINGVEDKEFDAVEKDVLRDLQPDERSRPVLFFRRAVLYARVYYGVSSCDVTLSLVFTHSFSQVPNVHRTWFDHADFGENHSAT